MVRTVAKHLLIINSSTMSILDHVKYKHPNKSIKANTDNSVVGKQKRIIPIKKGDVQGTGNSTQMVSQRPEVCGSIRETESSRLSVSSKKPRTLKGANPNKSIIQRTNKGFNRVFKSLKDLEDLLPDDTQ